MIDNPKPTVDDEPPPRSRAEEIYYAAQKRADRRHDRENGGPTPINYELYCEALKSEMIAAIAEILKCPAEAVPHIEVPAEAVRGILKD